MTDFPTKDGIYWAAFENEDGDVLEVALVKVCLFSSGDPQDPGGVVDFVDDSFRQFRMRSMDQEIVQPSHLIATADGPGYSRHQQVRVTWHGLAKPPRKMPKPVAGAQPV